MDIEEKLPRRRLKRKNRNNTFVCIIKFISLTILALVFFFMAMSFQYKYRTDIPLLSPFIENLVAKPLNKVNITHAMRNIMFNEFSRTIASPRSWREECIGDKAKENLVEIEDLAEVQVKYGYKIAVFAKDDLLSYKLRTEGAWEKELSSRIQQFFGEFKQEKEESSEDKGSVTLSGDRKLFIDIGAHIGYFSSIVTNLGHVVLAGSNLNPDTVLTHALHRVNLSPCMFLCLFMRVYA